MKLHKQIEVGTRNGRKSGIVTRIYNSGIICVSGEHDRHQAFSFPLAMQPK